MAVHTASTSDRGKRNVLAVGLYFSKEGSGLHSHPKPRTLPEGTPLCSFALINTKNTSSSRRTHLTVQLADALVVSGGHLMGGPEPGRDLGALPRTVAGAVENPVSP